MPGVISGSFSATFRRHRAYSRIMTTSAAARRPNLALAAARRGRGYSQSGLASAMRKSGHPTVSKRTVQRWEDGTTTKPSPSLAAALRDILNLPIDQLGFEDELAVRGDGAGGHHVERPASESALDLLLPRPQDKPNPGAYSGIWLSHYQYFSSGRGKTYSAGHYVVVIQNGDKLAVRSLPGSAASTLSMDLVIDTGTADGTWVENTDPDGYYRGARYHGVVQFLIEPTGRFRGQWVGFGKNFEHNSGPWEMVFMTASTAKSAIEEYNRPPDFSHSGVL